MCDKDSTLIIEETIQATTIVIDNYCTKTTIEIAEISNNSTIEFCSIGEPGLSAYQIAVANGFVGTEAQWLESLKGDSYDETFETVSKNLKGKPYVLNYTGGKLTSIEYTIASGNITKTLNYTGDKLTSLVLSGATPTGISLTKTLTYTENTLTNITYS